ncbi:hypothetical protein ACIGW4_34440 [Streptomyces sp. NPDC053513]|uniref:hypothetical protein n=1 Tax=unclassified Streptomyces TaxID=2593676 RepID=UPI0037CE8071
MVHIRSTLVVATALVAGVVPATAAAAAPVTAVTATAATAEMGTAVQKGGPLTVRVGEGAPVTTRFTVTLPASVTGRLTAGLVLGDLPGPSAGGDNLPGAECSVNGDAYRLCGWNYDTPEYEDSYGDGYVLSLPPTEAARTLTFDVRIDPAHPAPLGEHTGHLEMKDASGTVVATGPAAVNFVLGTPEANRRATVHARDKDGVLWQYESTGDPARPFEPRVRIGGGWNAYDVVRGAADIDGWSYNDGVARDKAVCLWLYKDAPTAARRQIGHGWNIYTAIV